MNTKTAHAVVTAVAVLAEQSARFCAQYGSQHLLKAGSAPEAWKAYWDMLEQQRQIAGLLDAEALTPPKQSGELWWKTLDVINTAAMLALALEAQQLLMRCAYAEAAHPDQTSTPAIMSSQALIAGILHPNAVQDPARGVYAA
jgi:hypothetical protein